MWRCNELREEKNSKKGAQISNREALVGRVRVITASPTSSSLAALSSAEGPHPTVRNILSRTSGGLAILLAQVDGNQLPDQTVIRTPLHYDVLFGGSRPHSRSSIHNYGQTHIVPVETPLSPCLIRIMIPIPGKAFSNAVSRISVLFSRAHLLHWRGHHILHFEFKSNSNTLKIYVAGLSIKSRGVTAL